MRTVWYLLFLHYKTVRKISSHGSYSVKEQKLFLGWYIIACLKIVQQKIFFFRSARALSSTGSTQVNFTAKDFFVTRLPRVDAHVNLSAQAVKDGLKFLELPARLKVTKQLSDELALNETILRAQRDAVNELKLMGEIYI